TGRERSPAQMAVPNVSLFHVGKPFGDSRTVVGKAALTRATTSITRASLFPVFGVVPVLRAPPRDTFPFLFPVLRVPPRGVFPLPFLVLFAVLRVVFPMTRLAVCLSSVLRPACPVELLECLRLPAFGACFHLVFL